MKQKPKSLVFLSTKNKRKTFTKDVVENFAIMRTVSEHSQAQTAYEPTLWAKVFHSVPHVNITFHSVNSQFNPENDLYLESLGILASIPAAWLITTLVSLVAVLTSKLKIFILCSPIIYLNHILVHR